MTVATDPKLVTQTWETKRLEARKQIRIARKQLTMEVQGWDKMLAKYESRAGQAGRTLIASSGALSQERVSGYLTEILTTWRY